MAFSGKPVFTVVDFGSSKIAVMHCRRDKAGNPEVAAYAMRPSDGCIVKGFIRSREKLENILTQTVADADAAMGVGSVRGNVYYIVSGSDMISRSGIGTALIYGDDKRITQEAVAEAVEKAENVTYGQDQILLDTFQTAFVLDSATRVFDPLQYRASRMEAIVHIILANRNRLTTFGSALYNLGFEGQILPLFSGVCSAYGTLTRDEREQGVLLIDMGAGTTDYFTVVKEGVVASGVIPVGMHHIINDTALGLGLSFEAASRIITENIYDRMRESGEANYEFKTAGDKVCSVPFASMDKIISARLNETMTLLKGRLQQENLLEQIRNGIVLTGGGALMPSVGEFASSVTGLHVRIGKAGDIAGSVTGLDSPRNSALLGAARYVLAQFDDEGTGGTIDRMTSALENLTGGLFNSMKRFKKAIR